MENSPPEYLAATSIPLANQEFSDINSEEVLQEVHSYLSLKHALLDRVIRARKLHHSRFFSLKLDYGHQHYLDSLQNQKFIVLRALERLERRTAEVLYKQKKWFRWVRQCQDDEEAQREKESKMIKREAALFRRHWNEIELRMKELRRKERIQLQEEFLETAYQTADQNRTSESKDEEDFNWDPVEDAVENERGNFLELIRHFLWQEKSTVYTEGDMQDRITITSHPSLLEKEAKAIPSKESTKLAEPTPAKDRNFRAKVNKPETLNGSKTSKKKKSALDSGIPNNPTEKVTSETRMQMRQRLQQGSTLVHDHTGMKVCVKRSIENPVQQAKTAPLPDDEIDRLLEEVMEIKRLLFCRILLSHAALLPAALRARSIEEFLNDKDVSLADLRDLCLKMEEPKLEEIRNACADLLRSEDEFEESELENDEDVVIAPKTKNKNFSSANIAMLFPNHGYLSTRKIFLSNVKHPRISEEK